jgi:hypothetical protein
MPPIRMGLMVSVAFVIVLSLDTGSEVKVADNVTVEGVRLTEPDK